MRSSKKPDNQATITTIATGRVYEYVDENGNLVVPKTEEEQIAAWEKLDGGRSHHWVENFAKALSEARAGRLPETPPKTRRPDLSPFSSRRHR